MTVFGGTKGDDVFNEASDSSPDIFNLRSGGSDTVLAGSGDDRFNMGAALNAADRLDGGAGNDVVILHGDYSAGLAFDDQTIQHVEQLVFKKGFDYNLTTADGNLAAGQFLKINAFALGASDSLTFNGAAESDGRLLVYGGAGNDTLTGGAKNDRFNLTAGGSDTAHGSGGNDVFLFGAAFTSGDVVDGGAGKDTLELNGAYNYTFGASQLAGIETLKLDAGHNYVLTTNDGNIAADDTLTVDFGALTSGGFHFSGSAEQDGSFHFVAGPVTGLALHGGNGADTFDLTGFGNGVVDLDGEDGDDLFLFGSNFNGMVISTFVGGNGNNTLEFNGDYTSLSVGFDVQLIETIRFDGGHSYGNVTVAEAAGNVTLDASQVSALFHLSFQNSDYTVEVGSGGMTASSSSSNAQDDTFIVTSRAALAASALNAGNGSDTLVLNGDFSLNFIFSATTATNFENITLGAGHSYDLVANNATVAAGATFTVDGSALSSSFTLGFNGGSETDGHFAFIDGAGADVLEGGALSDTFDLSRSDGTFASGGAGDDTFTVASATKLQDDFIDGGSGFNTLVLNGDFSSATPVTASNVTNIEALDLLGAANSYNLTIGGGVAGDDVVAVDASAAASLILDASGVAIAVLVVTGSAGGDHLIGTNQRDTFTGGAGADTLTGGGAADIFTYTSAAESTSTTYDTITDFAGGTDQFDLTTTVTSTDGAVGLLDSGANFDAELQPQLASHMASSRAVVFIAVAGTLSGHTFLIVAATAMRLTTPAAIM